MTIGVRTSTPTSFFFITMELSIAQIIAVSNVTITRELKRIGREAVLHDSQGTRYLARVPAQNHEIFSPDYEKGMLPTRGRLSFL
jgi:hypothetical protein